jgi:hypothetical protein
MNSRNAANDLDDVLDRFMLEHDQGSMTLERYVRDYPQFASQLIDLSRMAATDEEISDAPLTGAAQSRIDAAWIAYSAALAQTPSADPFQALMGDRGKSLATALGVPRQVVTCFREHRILATTVPRPVLRVLAEEFDIPLPHVIAAMAGTVQASLGRRFKADGEPGFVEQKSFEQVLVEAGVSDGDRARLMTDD